MCAWLPQHSAKIVGPAPLCAVNERERQGGGRERVCLFVRVRVYMCNIRMRYSVCEYALVYSCVCAGASAHKANVSENQKHQKPNITDHQKTNI